MDEELEMAIDMAGREKVFQIAKDNGWTSMVPKHIWWQICAQLMNRQLVR